MKKFRTILSLKAKYKAHSGALEAAGVSIMLRWLLRSPEKHNARVCALVDAQAVIGALAKGRSSAPTLRHELQRIAALSLAGGWCMRYVYVPSAFNPADAPSRNRVIDARGAGGPLQGVRKKLKPSPSTPTERAHRDWLKSLRKCRMYESIPPGGM